MTTTSTTASISPKEDLVGDRGAEMTALQARRMVRRRGRRRGLQDAAGSAQELRARLLRGGISRRPARLPQGHDQGRVRQRDALLRTRQHRLETVGCARVTALVREGKRHRRARTPTTDASFGASPARSRIGGSRSSWKAQILSGFGITKLVTECFMATQSARQGASRHNEGYPRPANWNLVVQHPVTPGDTIPRAMTTESEVPSRKARARLW